MRIVSKILTTLLIGMTACNSVNKKSEQATSVDSYQTKADSSLPKTIVYHEPTPEEQKAFREEEISDSLIELKTLNIALSIAEKNKSKRDFTFHTDSFDIHSGYIFSTSIKHLLINRHSQRVAFSDIYKLQDNVFIKVCSKEMAPLAYIDDTIQDVNGDNRLDYLFHWYPMSGCCTRDIYNVFLQKQNGNFSDEFEFINPTFSAKEKIIRGMCYGWPALLYKYKWNNYAVDTIEYIYFPDSTNGNHCLRRKHKDENEKGEILKSLPDEYKKIGYGYD